MRRGELSPNRIEFINKKWSQKMTHSKEIKTAHRKHENKQKGENNQL